MKLAQVYRSSNRPAVSLAICLFYLLAFPLVRTAQLVIRPFACRGCYYVRCRCCSRCGKRNIAKGQTLGGQCIVCIPDN